jgi:hypothetical protein
MPVMYRHRGNDILLTKQPNTNFIVLYENNIGMVLVIRNHP